MLARSLDKSSPTISFDAEISNLFIYLGLEKKTVYLSGAMAAHQQHLILNGIDAQLWQKETTMSSQDTLMISSHEWMMAYKSFDLKKNILILNEADGYWNRLKTYQRLYTQLKHLKVQSFVLLSSIEQPVSVLDYDRKVIFDYFEQRSFCISGFKLTICRLKNILKTLLIRPNGWLVRT